MIQALKQKFPNIVGPHCAGHLLRDGEPPGGGEERGAQADLVLVVGSNNSSNSNRLVEVSRIWTRTPT